MMDKKRRFLPIAAIAAVALVAAACSSSDDAVDSGGPVMPVMVDLDGVTDGTTAEAGTIEIPAGTSMDSGNTAFACAADGDDCTVTITVDADDDTVSATSTGGMVTAGNSADHQMAIVAAKRAEAHLVAGAIGPEGRAADLDDQTPGIQMPFTANGETFTTTDPATPTDMTDDFTMSDDSPADLGDGWAGARYTRATTADDETTAMMNESVMDTVVVYTDIDDPTEAAYSTYFSVDRGGADGSADADTGVLRLNNGQVGENSERFVTADFGITDAHQTVPHPTPDDPDTTEPEDSVEIMSSFYGIPGTFTCTGDSCTALSDMDGTISGLGGSWTFTPTLDDDDTNNAMELMEIMVAGVVPDPLYITMGYWLRDDYTGMMMRGLTRPLPSPTPTSRAIPEPSMAS